MINITLRDGYINLLKSSLLNELYIEEEAKLIHTFNCIINNILPKFDEYLNIHSLPEYKTIFKLLENSKLTGNPVVFTGVNIDDGSPASLGWTRNYTEVSHTMIGRSRLDNLQNCVETILREDIPGDFIETGIWRGGACIFMRGLLLAYNDNVRNIWAADSFEGVPRSSLMQDLELDLSVDILPVLAVSLQEVKDLMSRYGLLDERIHFLKGWFKDTLTIAPINSLSLLRLDGDLYESTIDALNPLYEKVSKGGFVIVDDYFSCPPCKNAITDFRAHNNIEDPIVAIDEQSAYWRKSI